MEASEPKGVKSYYINMEVTYLDSEASIYKLIILENTKFEKKYEIYEGLRA